MTKSITLLLIAAALTTTSFAAPKPQQPAPPPDLASQIPAAKPGDVDSIDHMMAAIYDVISGPPGKRDWDRFRSLFVPGGRLTSTTKPPNATASDAIPVRLLTVEDYVNRAGDYFNTHGFFERAAVNKVQRFGNIAQVFSSYESRHTADEKPFTRGINSMQLLYDGKRWYFLSILWDEESATNPIPPDMSK
jgi:hypothetical protein